MQFKQKILTMKVMKVLTNFNEKNYTLNKLHLIAAPGGQIHEIILLM